MSENHHHYVAPLPVLFGTFACLVGLTIITVFQATQEYAEFGRWETPLTLSIATVKAALVALFFMQLAHDKPMNGIILISSLLFLALFLTFALLDTHQYGPQVHDFLISNPKAPDSP